MNLIRALLLTDIVDSTRVAQELGDAAFAALSLAHDRAARDLLPHWRGREIDKTDGLLLLFESAADAVGYALAYHRSLARLGLPFKARAGLHVGPVTLRPNSAADVALGAKPLEIEGINKPIAARVMELAHGGQTLLSEAARRQLGEGDNALRLQSHGHWRLKGLPEPLELFEVGEPGAPFMPPPDAAKAYRVVRQGDLWQPVREIKHSIPAEHDSFVGRHEPMHALAHNFEQGTRLVSVLGMGGTGKTRLVTHFGRHWLGEFGGGVWFCDLSQARGLDGIAHAVAQGLEVPLGTGDPVTQLGHAIAGRGNCLVILDNFEQVTRHAAETLGKWLDRAADARFLVTTREVLGLPGEQVLALAPLLPDEAAHLFLQRAKAAKPDFLPTADDLAAIDPLVKLLDGLPLAVELAAARVRVMPARTLLARMRERFKLLVSSGGRVDRQATLRAVFDWSWELLTEPEKAALAQLSVFEGGLTLEAGEAVLDLSGGPQVAWPVDLLQSLVQKSFIYQVGDARFGLLVSVQEYAGEHLCTPHRYAGSGPDAALSAQTRHGAYFAGLEKSRTLSGQGTDLANFVTACRRAVSRNDTGMAVTLLERAWESLKLQGPFRVGSELASQVLAMHALGGAAAARAQWVAGNAMQWCGRYAEAHPHFEVALALARSSGEPHCAARALRNLGDLDIRAGRTDEARAHYGAAMESARALRDGQIESDVHNGLGNLDEALGRIEDARAHYETALTLARDCGDRQREGSILGNLGLLSADQGRMEEALVRHEAALTAAREAGNLRLEGSSLCNLGMLLQLLGRAAQAQPRLAAALATARALGYAQLESNVLCNLGIVYESLARPEQAQAHYEAALNLARMLGDTGSEGQFLGYLGLLHARQSRHALGRECLDAGQALLSAVSEQIGLAVLLCSRAEAEHLAGDSAAALLTLMAADAIGAEVGAGPESEIGLSLARVRALVG